MHFAVFCMHMYSVCFSCALYVINVRCVFFCALYVINVWCVFSYVFMLSMYGVCFPVFCM